MKKRLFFIAALVVALASCSGNKSEMDRFIDDLMSKMTVEEKIGQLNLPVAGDIVTGQAKSSNVSERIRNGEVGGLFNLKGADKIREVQRIAVEESRLGIPILFGMDVIHGYETIFPIPLGLSCSWDMAAVEQSARIAAEEASADGISWTFSPMVDVSRDPRWGRVSEGSGEDTYLGCRIAEAMVRGYQGPDKETQLTQDDQILACVKHFALYGAPEAGRDYNTVDMSRIRMYNEYFPPYKAAIDAGAASVMASFNEIDGVPATGNRWLLTDVLRDQWGFGGFVVTDYTGIYEMIAHGVGDFEQVSVQALKAGVDMDMVSEGFVVNVKNALDKGLVSMKDIDLACRRILEAKYRVGLFADPYKFCRAEDAAQEVYCQEHRDIARKIASESFVLLKNENVLPLKKQGTIGLIGPLADTKSNMPGTWSVAARLDVPKTLREGLADAVKGKAEVLSITYSDDEAKKLDDILGEEIDLKGKDVTCYVYPTHVKKVDYVNLDENSTTEDYQTNVKALLTVFYGSAVLQSVDENGKELTEKVGVLFRLKYFSIFFLSSLLLKKVVSKNKVALSFG